jgi:hypothetical protein
MKWYWTAAIAAGTLVGGIGIGASAQFGHMDTRTHCVVTTHSPSVQEDDLTFTSHCDFQRVP